MMSESQSHIYVKEPGPRTQARPTLEIKQKIRKKILEKILDLLSMIYIKFQIQQKAKKIQGESNSITNLHVSRPSRAESARPNQLGQPFLKIYTPIHSHLTLIEMLLKRYFKNDSWTMLRKFDRSDRVRIAIQFILCTK